MPPIVSAHHLSKRYRSLWALNDAGLEIHPGEVLGIIGPNGSGKTTLCECLSGTIPATTGSLRRLDRELGENEIKATFFYVPDGVRPWPEQTVAWVLQFLSDIQGVSWSAAGRVAEEMSLGAHMGRRIRTLSKGEHKRVMLACGLIAAAPIAVFDEPFDGLDLRQTRETTTVLRAHASRGRTLVLSIHQLADAERVCDRLVLLNAGRITASGTPAELRAKAGINEGGLDEVFLALT